MPTTARFANAKCRSERTLGLIGNPIEDNAWILSTHVCLGVLSSVMKYLFRQIVS